MVSPSARYRATADDSRSDDRTEYRPGVCNIGRTEQRRRYRYAAVGALVTLGYLAALVVTDAPTGLVLGAFAPLALAVEFSIQARTQFCVRFALRGRYDFTGSGGDSGRVTASANRRADTVSAAKVTVFSLLVAGVATGALYVGGTML
ncbi:hypothetical protein [Halomarina oriensis]|uniref:Uncharacterized protein n=1 Tax=Halomarina oriensis TaxID=671145 RepID=A0A6B0GM69_9EURY|nr:hypothetical protein [Halomarina oriensis]MWG35750.1 hypothetical protein [Halomarina oriensis]